MNSHWLKQVYARMLKENTDPKSLVKIFKQEEDETSPDLVASIQQKYAKDILNKAKNYASRGGIDTSFAESVLERFHAKRLRGLEDDLFDVITSYSITDFNQENCDRFAKSVSLVGESEGMDNLVNVMRESFSANVNDESALKRLVDYDFNPSGKEAKGKGEYAFGLLGGGFPATTGDVRYDVGGSDVILEIKGKDARIGKSMHEVTPYQGMLDALEDFQSEENFVKVAEYMAGANASDSTKEEIRAAAYPVYRENKDSIYKTFLHKTNGGNLRSSQDAAAKKLFRIGVMGELKTYQDTAKFDYYVFLGVNSPSFPFKCINPSKHSVQDLYNMSEIEVTRIDFGKPTPKPGMFKGSQLNYRF